MNVREWLSENARTIGLLLYVRWTDISEWLAEKERSAVEPDNERAEMVELLKRWLGSDTPKPSAQRLREIQNARNDTEALLKRLGELDD